MAYTLKTKLANKGNYGSSRNTANIKYIVIHFTANDGDSDEANGNYFNKNVVKASAHYFVDSDSVTQSVPDNYTAWSVGGSKYSNCATTGGGSFYKVCSNTNSISIELCDDKKDGVIKASQATIDNAIELTKSLMAKYNIPVENVIRHFDVTGKLCPAYWCGDAAKNALWLTEFKNKLSGQASSTQPTTPAPAYSYTQQQFVRDVLAILGVTTASAALAKTMTISATTNKSHILVTPIERYMKGLGYYTGSIEADSGKTPSFGSGMTAAVKLYQKNVVKASSSGQDGIISAKGATWKKMLGLS